LLKSSSLFSVISFSVMKSSLCGSRQISLAIGANWLYSTFWGISASILVTLVFKFLISFIWSIYGFRTLSRVTITSSTLFVNSIFKLLSLSVKVKFTLLSLSVKLKCTLLSLFVNWALILSQFSYKSYFVTNYFENKLLLCWILSTRS
jgi:hypothetical protein